jgi:phosphoglycolate phosphatase
MAFKAVLFDLDGTLLDTLEDLADACNAALNELGYDIHPIDSYRYFVGDGVVTLAQRVLPVACRDPDSVRQCVELVREHYANCWDLKTKPYPGILSMLDELDKRQIRKVILSNKPDDFTKLTVSKLLSGRQFDVVRGVGDDGIKKPDPAKAFEIANMLNIEPADFLYLGDTNTDMQTATAAGMYAVGVLWGFRTAKELKEAGARIMIKEPMELLDVLENYA